MLHLLPVCMRLSWICATTLPVMHHCCRSGVGVGGWGGGGRVAAPTHQGVPVMLYWGLRSPILSWAMQQGRSMPVATAHAMASCGAPNLGTTSPR
jgi:hypothetical protein